MNLKSWIIAHYNYQIDRAYSVKILSIR